MLLRCAYFCFVIKVAGEQEVRGQIKLKFRDVTGSPIVVTRTLVSQQKVCLHTVYKTEFILTDLLQTAI